MSMRYRRFNADTSSNVLLQRPYSIVNRHDLCLLELPYAITFDDFQRYAEHDTSEYLEPLWEVISGHWWTASGYLYTDSSNARIRFRTNYPQISGDWSNYNFLGCRVGILNQLPYDYFQKDVSDREVFGGGLIDVNNGEYVVKTYDYYSHLRLEHNGTIVTREGHQGDERYATACTLYINPNDAVYISNNELTDSLIYEVTDDTLPVSSVCLGTSNLLDGQIVRFDNFKYIVPKADIRLLGTQVDINTRSIGGAYLHSHKHLANDMIFTKYCKDCISSAPLCRGCYHGRFPSYFQVVLSNYTGTLNHILDDNDGNSLSVDLSQLNGTYILDTNINSIDAYYGGIYNTSLYYETCVYTCIADIIATNGYNLKLLIRLNTLCDNANPLINVSIFIVIPNEDYYWIDDFHIDKYGHGNLLTFDKNVFDIGNDYSYNSYDSINKIGLVFPECSPTEYMTLDYSAYWNIYDTTTHYQVSDPIEYADFSEHRLWVESTGVWVNGTYFDKTNTRDEIHIPDTPGEYAVYYGLDGNLQISNYQVDENENMVFDYVKVKHFFGVPTNRTYITQYPEESNVSDRWEAEWATDAYRYQALPKLNMTYIPTTEAYPNFNTAFSRLSFSHGFDNVDDSVLEHTNNTVSIAPVNDSFRIISVQYPASGIWMDDIYPAFGYSKTDVFYTKYKNKKTLEVPNSGTWYLCYVLKDSINTSYGQSLPGKLYQQRYGHLSNYTRVSSQIDGPRRGTNMWFELCWLQNLEDRVSNEYAEWDDARIIRQGYAEPYIPSSDYTSYVLYAKKIPIAKVDCVNGNIGNFEDLRTSVVGTGIAYSYNVEFAATNNTIDASTIPTNSDISNGIEYQGYSAAWSAYHNLYGTLEYMPFTVGFDDVNGIISIIPKEDFYIHIGETIIKKIETETATIDKTKLQRRYGRTVQPLNTTTSYFDYGSYANNDTKDFMIMLGQGYIGGYDINGNFIVEECDEAYKDTPFSDDGFFNDFNTYHHNGDIIIPLFLTTYNKVVYHRFVAKHMIVWGFNPSNPYDVSGGDTSSSYIISPLQSLPATKVFKDAGFMCKEFNQVAMSGGRDIYGSVGGCVLTAI